LSTPRIAARCLKRSTTSRPGQGITPRSGAVPSLRLCLWPSPASRTLTSHARLVQASLDTRLNICHLNLTAVSQFVSSGLVVFAKSPKAGCGVFRQPVTSILCIVIGPIKDDLPDRQPRNVRRILVRGSMSPCRLRRRKF